MELIQRAQRLLVMSLSGMSCWRRMHLGALAGGLVSLGIYTCLGKPRKTGHGGRRAPAVSEASACLGFGGGDCRISTSVCRWAEKHGGTTGTLGRRS